MLLARPLFVPRPVTLATVPVLAVIVPPPILSILIIVPAVTTEVAVQLNALSLVSAHPVPFHSLSSKKMVSPMLISTRATKAILSLPSALNPTNAIFPAASAILESPLIV